MRPRAGPVKTGAEVGGFGSGLAAGLAVGLLGLAALSVGGAWRQGTGSAVELPLPEDGAEPPRYWPGMSPEEQAAREPATAPVPDADADRSAREEPVVDARPGDEADPLISGTDDPSDRPVPEPAIRVDDPPVAAATPDAEPAGPLVPAARMEPDGTAEPAAEGADEPPAPPSEPGLEATSVDAGSATAGPAVRAGAALEGPTEEAVANGGPQAVADPASPLPAPPAVAGLAGTSPPLKADGAVGSRPAPNPASVPEAGSAVPALLRHSAPFEPPAEPHPYLSIVLLDDGSVPDAPDRLDALPFPVSVALDLPVEAAAAREAAWRAAGFEVLAVAALPEDARLTEVEVVLGAAVDALAESVAVLDLGEGGLAARTTLSPTALARVARGGRGLVLAGGASSSSLDAAAAAGVPAARVLRELDAADQDAVAVRRILDDVARRATQSGEAVVLGRVRSDTLEGLADWAQSQRAGEVTVAPVSALLARIGPVQQDR